jgi:hypothetical protein
MGFIRGSLLVILSFLLLLSVLLGSIFLSLTWSLQYDNVKGELSSLAKELTDDQYNIVEEDFNMTEEMDEAIENMRDYCINNTEYVFSEGGYTFVLPCEDLEEFDRNPEALAEVGAETIVEQTYYDDYDCNFWNCFNLSEFPFFLVSEKAKNYWKASFYYSLIVAVILIILIFLLLEQKINTAIIVGSALVLSSFPLAKLENIVSSFVGGSYLSFIGIFFSKAGSVFLIILISGIAILGVGILWRFLNFDSLKKKFSRREVREIVRKEVSRKKKK